MYMYMVGGAILSFISEGRMDKFKMSYESFYYFHRNKFKLNAQDKDCLWFGA